MSERAQLIASLLVAAVIVAVTILPVSARAPVDDDGGGGKGRGRGRGGDEDALVAPNAPVRLGSVVSWPPRRTSTSPTR